MSRRIGGIDETVAKDHCVPRMVSAQIDGSFEDSGIFGEGSKNAIVGAGSRELVLVVAETDVHCKYGNASDLIYQCTVGCNRAYS